LNEIRPLLVTGVPRSGTTWLGRMISASKYYFYVHEFINPVCLFQKTQPFQKYHYIDEHNIHRYEPILQKLNSLTYKSEMEKNIIKHTVKETVQSFYSMKRRVLGYPKPLLKEPNACFSSDFLAQRYGWKVIILVRHPAAVAASFNRVEWPSDLDRILQQKTLIQKYFSEIPLEKYRDRLEKISLLWLMVMSVLTRFLEKNKDWILVRHEDLCRNPLGEFEKIFEKLNIFFSKKMKNKIISSTQSETVTPENKNPFHLKRNSRKLACAWQGQLTAEEIEKIKSIVRPVSDHYYSDQDWMPKEMME
jgi:hypothetical protein